MSDGELWPPSLLASQPRLEGRKGGRGRDKEGEEERVCVWEDCGGRVEK